MLIVEIINWFKTKENGKFWFITLYSIIFSSIMTLVTRSALFLVDTYLRAKSSEAFSWNNIIVSLVFAFILGLYLSNNAWKDSK